MADNKLFAQITEVANGFIVELLGSDKQFEPGSRFIAPTIEDVGTVLVEHHKPAPLAAAPAPADDVGGGP